MTTITIKDEDTEITITREAGNISDMLSLFEDALRGLGYSFNGNLQIKKWGENEE